MDKKYLVFMPDCEFYIARKDEYHNGWSEYHTGDFLGDEHPNSQKSTPLWYHELPDFLEEKQTAEYLSKERNKHGYKRSN